MCILIFIVMICYVKTNILYLCYFNFRLYLILYQYSKIMVHLITTTEELKAEIDGEKNKGKLIVIDFFAT